MSDVGIGQKDSDRRAMFWTTQWARRQLYTRADLLEARRGPRDVSARAHAGRAMELASNDRSLLLQARVGSDARADDQLVDALYRRMCSEANLEGSDGNGVLTIDATLVTRAAFRSITAEEIADFHVRARLLLAAARALRRLLVRGAQNGTRSATDGAPVTSEDDDSADTPSGRIRFDPGTIRCLRSLDSGLDRLSEIQPTWADVVTCIFFGKISFAETAAALDITPAAARCYWTLARTWLCHHGSDATGTPGRVAI